MSANVENMFSVLETPWHGLGRIVMDAPASHEALELAGLDWQVESRNIYSGTGAMIPGYRANVRSTDDAVLGVVSDRYRIVQNEEAFQFTDDLLGEGVTYETAGSLQGGKKVWIKRDTVPDGLYAYDVRHDDECRGIPCEIAPFVMVNHWGTIILAEPLELPDDGRRYIDEETDWDYSPLEGKGTADHEPCTTISTFMAVYGHQKLS